MMRNWFILFATTFTITTLIVSIAIPFSSMMSEFNHKYVIHLAMTSAILSLYMTILSKLVFKNYISTIICDLFVIFLIIYIPGYYIFSYPIHLYSLALIFILVVVIYTVITLIYYFILTKEAEQMNRKIKGWRHKHANSGQLK